MLTKIKDDIYALNKINSTGADLIKIHADKFHTYTETLITFKDPIKLLVMDQNRLIMDGQVFDTKSQ